MYPPIIDNSTLYMQNAGTNPLTSLYQTQALLAQGGSAHKGELEEEHGEGIEAVRVHESSEKNNGGRMATANSSESKVSHGKDI